MYFKDNGSFSKSCDVICSVLTGLLVSNDFFYKFLNHINLNFLVSTYESFLLKPVSSYESYGISVTKSQSYTISISLTTNIYMSNKNELFYK